MKLSIKKAELENWNLKIIIVFFFILGIVCLSFVNSEAFASTLIHTLTEPDPMTGREFGANVDTDGKYVLIGAHHSYNIMVGKAYLYDATSGNLLHTFTSPVTTPACNSFACDDFFGTAVAINGNNILIGASEDGDSNGQGGGVVYQYDATTYNLIRKITDPIPQTYDGFGFAVAIDGNNILIGEAYGYNLHQSKQAYIFDATTGEHVHTLDDPFPQAGSQFGYSVAIDGDIAAVGSWGDSFGTTTEAGSVSVYSVSTGNFIRTINNPEPDDFDWYGYDVAIDGTDLVIGAINDDDEEALITQYGKVYFHNASSGNQVNSLNESFPYPVEQFGRSVSIKNNTVLIGAPGFKVCNVERTMCNQLGRVYLHDFSSGNLLETLDNPTQSFDYFGGDVAISSNYIVIGVEGWGVSDIGAAYIYDRYPGEFLYEGSVVVDTEHNGQMPLKEIKIKVEPNIGSPKTIRTNENGEFSVTLPDDATSAIFWFTLEDTLPTFHVSDGDIGAVAAFIKTESIPFDSQSLEFVIEEGYVLSNDVPYSILDKNLSTNLEIKGLAILYAHSWDYMAWAHENLNINFTYDLPILGSKSGQCDFFNDVPFVHIKICDDTTNFSNSNLPWYHVQIIGHEITHYIEYLSQMVGGQNSYDDSRDAGDNNHAGYQNTNSKDAIAEGFAQFLSMVMREQIYSHPPTIPTNPDRPAADYELNELAPGVHTGNIYGECGLTYYNLSEEDAVASLLWDLYDSCQENSSDTKTIPIAQLWTTLNVPSLSTIDSMYDLLSAANYDVDNLYKDRLIYLDADESCDFTVGDTIGVTDWILQNSTGPVDSVFAPISPPRAYAPPIDFKNLVEIKVLHAITNEILENFIVTTTIDHDFTNVCANLNSETTENKSSSYIFNAFLPEPGTIHMEFEKDGVTGSTDVTFAEFWDAYIVSPELTEGVLFTKTVTLDLGAVSPPSCAPPVSGDWIVNQDCMIFLDVTAPANIIVQNNSLLTISGGSTVNVDFENYSLMVNSNSGVLVKSGSMIT